MTHDKLSSHYETFPVHFTPTVMLTVCTVSLIGRWYVKYDYVGSLISVHQPGRRRRSNNLSFAELLTTIAAGRHCLLSWPSRPSSRIPSPRNLLIDSKGLLHQATGLEHTWSHYLVVALCAGNFALRQQKLRYCRRCLEFRLYFLGNGESSQQPLKISSRMFWRCAELGVWGLVKLKLA